MASNEPKRVLVTGASGFTGQYVTTELKKAGYRVITLGSKPAEGKDCFQVDLLDSEQLTAVVQQSRPDHVIHLAAIAFVAHADARAFYDVNLIGTRYLLQALSMSDHPLTSVLLVSSANVYGNSSAGSLSEQTAPDPVNDYAVSKLAMEYMAHTYRAKLPLIITRPFNYTGVGQESHFVIPKIVSHFRERKSEIELGNLQVWRDFGDVRKVAQAYRQLIETPAAVGHTINISTGKATSLGEIIGICEQITGHSLDVKVNRAFVRENEVQTLTGNSDLLRSLIPDWSPLDIRDTLSWMLTGDDVSSPA
ncbi:putative nucleoside-diphosphate-sugar epimerase [Advenella mimigardefordensis DPN7]|uniref:Putative nucleoside-diphosphate-sugar epimerase n=2 Tax=Advenella mimigardefordensis TaxID=302406 RepID=W0PBD6_ADVMD|nr:putative nucleoside-diphosphate-sugar epimerase [Advenella mimigardefordensis DPN7]